MVQNRVGPPVRGQDFYDRVQELDVLLDLLHRDHVLLLAPRRVGKTSLMRRVEEAASERGLHAVYVSVAETSNELGFVNQLLGAVGSRKASAKIFATLRKSAAGKQLKRVRRLEAAGFGFELSDVEADWSVVGEELLRALDLQPGRWLVLIDELPMFVLRLLRSDGSVERTRRFLEWFRAVRQRSDMDGTTRWLLAGSIGLDTVAARENLGDTINDLHVYHLGPFSESASDGLLRELSSTHDLPLDEGVRRHMAQRIGWLIPYHLQLLFSHLRSRCREEGAAATREAVDAAYESLLAPSSKAYFDYWRQRLHEELGQPDAGYALLLLDTVARDEAGASRDTLRQVLHVQVADPMERGGKLRYLLDVLESDGYLVEREDRFLFRSPLVRAYWVRRVLP